MSTPTTLLQAIDDCLAQLLQLLAKLPESDYQQPCSAAMGSSIGSHLRHSLDHFSSILRGLDDNLIDYDARQRDDRIANSPAFAQQVIRDMRREFSGLSVTRLETPYSVRNQVNHAHAPLAQSTLGRELMFAVSHAIHHNALIHFILRSLGRIPPKDFGLAPSTASYLASPDP